MVNKNGYYTCTLFVKLFTVFQHLVLTY